MATIPQKELRNQIGEVLRRAESGEEITVTVSGRPVARLGPIQARQWVSGRAAREIWNTPAPESLADDLEHLPADLLDPFAS